jgi:DNA polymerase theta
VCGNISVQLLMVHRILKTHRKALFVVPYVSIAREKTAYFHSLFGPKPSSTSQGLKVKGYYGLQGGDTLGSTDIAVCTIEKANAVINKSLASGKLCELLLRHAAWKRCGVVFLTTVSPFV